MSVALAGCGKASLTETTNTEKIEIYYESNSPPMLGALPTVTIVSVEIVPAIEPSQLTEINGPADSPGYAVAERIDPPEPTKTMSIAEFALRSELTATYNARQCVIDHESRNAGMYTAEYGGSASGSDGSTASGAYQWLNSSWSNYLGFAEKYYEISLTSPDEAAYGARYHAAYATPFTQDLVSTFAFMHRNLAQNQKPWPYAGCWNVVGSEMQVRSDGPVNEPTPYVQMQLDFN